MARTFWRQLARVFVRAIHLNFEGSLRAVTGFETQDLDIGALGCALAIVKCALSRDMRVAEIKSVERCFMSFSGALI